MGRNQTKADILLNELRIIPKLIKELERIRLRATRCCQVLSGQTCERAEGLDNHKKIKTSA